MTPTMELRFVEREIEVPMDWDVVGTPIYKIKKTVRVLQQKWVEDYTYPDERTRHYREEWRDVPLVKDEA